MLQIAASIDKGAPGLAHFFAINGHKAVYANLGGGAVIGTLEHGWPKQGVEVNNILADKMVQLGTAVGGPVLVEVYAVAVAEIFKCGHIANGGIQPDIKIFAWSIGDFKTKVGCITADIPFLQPAIQPFAQFIGYLSLHGAAAGPFLQKLSELRKLKKVVSRLFFNGCGPRDS